MTRKSIYPLDHDRLYAVGDLREAEAMLPADRQADQSILTLKSAGSQRDRLGEIAQRRMVATVLCDGLGLDKADTFRWTPAGAADFVIASSEKTLNVQCTMAYDEPEEAKYKRGHLHHLEMKHQEANGFFFGGGGISEPAARDVMEQLVTWRSGIVRAVETSWRRRTTLGNNSICWSTPDNAPSI
jgi:hypothetical protein